MGGVRHHFGSKPNTKSVDGAAGGADMPNLEDLHAFVADGRQAVSYDPGTWHHPIVALDDLTDFVCLVHEDGTAGDCVEFAISPSLRPVVARP